MTEQQAKRIIELLERLIEATQNANYPGRGNYIP